MATSPHPAGDPPACTTCRYANSPTFWSPADYINSAVGTSQWNFPSLPFSSHPFPSLPKAPHPPILTTIRSGQTCSRSRLRCLSPLKHPFPALRSLFRAPASRLHLRFPRLTSHWPPSLVRPFPVRPRCPVLSAPPSPSLLALSSARLPVPVALPRSPFPDLARPFPVLPCPRRPPFPLLSPSRNRPNHPRPQCHSHSPPPLDRPPTAPRKAPPEDSANSDLDCRSPKHAPSPGPQTHPIGRLDAPSAHGASSPYSTDDE
ncbi:hypothetical protein SAMN05421854_104111 [Amycolatopsis rubida]|uniref:Uncharacterized protein n=1 Tax=Amycolatopsis rubida TaxID=112413 RepID=A0A1I5MQ99_9PSEU|nr:hypothetical protein SAMN05421854_104111 [Amycolatopsis rubida]